MYDERLHVRRRLLAISFSLAVGAALMGMKFYVYWLTASSAILSDALESIINVVASGFAFGSIVLAAKPPDPTHPYGHGKIEYFSAGFEGALIVLAAVGIFIKGVPQILHPRDLPNLDSGLMLLLLASLINLALAVGLIRVGKQTRSLVLVADGKHILSDVYTSGGVLLGLVLVRLTGYLWLDGALACIMAVNILVIGGKLIRQSFAGLMDASDPELLQEICNIINSNRRDTWIDIHRLRAWRSGDRAFVDFHLILPRELSLEQAHNEVSKLEGILKAHFGNRLDALIHAEPCVEPECPICSLDPCNLRTEPVRAQRLWHREAVTGESSVEKPLKGLRHR